MGTTQDGYRVELKKEIRMSKVRVVVKDVCIKFRKEMDEYEMSSEITLPKQISTFVIVLVVDE